MVIKNRFTSTLPLLIMLPAVMALLTCCKAFSTYESCKKKWNDSTFIDTVKVADTTFIEVSGDTIRTYFHDTSKFYIEERERTKLIVKRDSVHTFIHCESLTDTMMVVDTVIQKIEKSNKYNEPEESIKWYHWLLIGAIAIIILLIVAKIL